MLSEPKRDLEFYLDEVFSPRGSPEYNLRTTILLSEPKPSTSPILQQCSPLLKSFHNIKQDHACQIHSDSFHFGKIWLCMASGMTIQPSQSLYGHPMRSQLLQLSITALLPIKLLALRAAFSSCLTKSQKQKRRISITKL